MAKKNPTSRPDPRFDPATDADNKRAHAKPKPPPKGYEAVQFGMPTMRARETPDDVTELEYSDNPTTAPDPRYDPATDDENAWAHEADGSVEPEPDEVDAQELVQRMLDEAIRHYEENLEPDQVKATEYYKGRPFGDELEGRSQVVSTTVRDATLAQMRVMLPMLFGPERIVEYEPVGPEDEDMARQATDYVVHKLRKTAFKAFHDTMQDGLVRRLGVVKWWWDEKPEIKAATFTGLDEAQVSLLINDPDVFDVEIVAQYALGNMIGAPMLYDVVAKRVEDGGGICVAAVPPEEFVYTPDARSLESAPLVAHVREVSASELIQMGIPRDVVEEHKGQRRDVDSEDMEHTRQFHGGETWRDGEEDRDPSQQLVVFAEAYVLIDRDGDGIAERRLFQCVGPEWEIVNGPDGELVDDVGFACWSPVPEAHTIVGQGNWDLLRDIQRIDSQVWRGMLDSLALSLDQATEVVQGEVNMKDVLSTEVGRVIRVRRPGMIREISHRFVGGDTLPVVHELRALQERRMGTFDGPTGLDADAMQSTTKQGVAAQLTAAQQHTAFLLLVMAEQMLVPLFRGLLRLITKHQDREEMVRLRNKWVAVDPRFWNADMDVAVNTSFTQRTDQERAEALMGVLNLQKELMAMGSPLVSQVEVRNTLQRLTELAGFKNSVEFFKAWGPEEEQQMQQAMAQQPPPPDPNMMLVQVEQMKAQVEAQIEAQKLELERWKAQMEEDRKRDELARKYVMEERKIEAEYAVKIDDNERKEQVARDRAELDADLKRQAQAHTE